MKFSEHRNANMRKNWDLSLCKIQAWSFIYLYINLVHLKKKMKKWNKITFATFVWELHREEIYANINMKDTAWIKAGLSKTLFGALQVQALLINVCIFLWIFFFIPPLTPPNNLGRRAIFLAPANSVDRSRYKWEPYYNAVAADGVDILSIILLRWRLYQGGPCSRGSNT